MTGQATVAFVQTLFFEGRIITWLQALMKIKYNYANQAICFPAHFGLCLVRSLCNHRMQGSRAPFSDCEFTTVTLRLIQWQPLPLHNTFLHGFYSHVLVNSMYAQAFEASNKKGLLLQSRTMDSCIVSCRGPHFFLKLNVVSCHKEVHWGQAVGFFWSRPNLLA